MSSQPVVTLPIKVSIQRLTPTKNVKANSPGPELRRFAINSDATLTEVKVILCQLWDMPELTPHLSVMEWKSIVDLEYMDCDNDPIALDCEEEWIECVRCYIESDWNGDANGKEIPLRMTMRRVPSRKPKHVNPEAPELDTQLGHQLAEVPPPQPFTHESASAAGPENQPSASLTAKDNLVCALAGTSTVAEACALSLPFVDEGEIDRVKLEKHANAHFDLLSDKGENIEALRFAKLFVSAFPADPVMWYNTACIASRLGQVDLAFDCLRKASVRGFNHIDHMRSDSDLENLREDLRFQGIIERMEEENGPAAPKERQAASSPKETMMQRIARELEEVEAFKRRMFGTEEDQKRTSERKVPSEPLPPGSLVTDLVQSGEWRLPSQPPVEEPDSLPQRVRTLMTVFPHLSSSDAELALRESGGSVQFAVNALLQHQRHN